MSHRSPKKWMEGSNYEDKCGQRADDVEGMSNREEKRKVSPRKEIGVNRNIIQEREMERETFQWRLQ